MPQSVETRCQWQQSEGRIISRVWAGPWETFLPGTALTRSFQMSWCSSHHRLQQQCWLPAAGMCRRKHSAAQTYFFTSSPMVCMSHMELPWLLVQWLGISLGGAAENFFEEGKDFILLVLLLRVLPSKCLLFPVNDFLLCCIIDVPVEFEKSRVCCSVLGGSWCCFSTWAGQAALLLPDKKTCTELLREAKPQFPALVQNWIFLTQFVSFKFTNPGTHGV